MDDIVRSEISKWAILIFLVSCLFGLLFIGIGNGSVAEGYQNEIDSLKIENTLLKSKNIRLESELINLRK